jgi:uncharacterized protein (TIGR00299 family) protein
MKIAYFDCFSGAAGDMIVAALLDAGADAAALREGLRGLGLDGFSIQIPKVSKQGIAATRFLVNVDPTAKHPHRHLKDITEIIRGAKLPRPLPTGDGLPPPLPRGNQRGVTSVASSRGLNADRVRDRAIRIFERLAQAEAQVHNTTIEKVHFHEVGAVDAIVDVVGASLCLESLGIERIMCSPIPTGSGTVKCEHGLLPVPGPATAWLLRGFPLAACDEVAELTTPTGAAILTTLADEFGPLPSMRLDAVGYGAGTRDNKTRPNVLRVLVGDSVASARETDHVAVLETNLDDCSPQTVAFCIERLLADGALDAYAVPIVMKKGRPGVLLTVLCDPARTADMERIVFAETTTLGIRRRVQERTKLPRRYETVATPLGEIRVKIGQGEGVVTATPEYEDCKAAALRHKMALREVIAAANAAWKSHSDTSRRDDG